MTEMGSPETAFVASPDRPPKRSGPPKSPVSDSMERPTYIKFLVSNSEAGSVIGKGGSTITDFQSQTGSRIQLSRSQEYFPGTSDRIIMISGTPNEVLMAMECILLKLCSEIRHEEGTGVDPRTKVRIIVPNSSCGALIGKGGATIKSLMEDSQAGIKISPQDNGYYGLNDRLVMVTGSVEEQMRAIDLILSKLIDDPHYSQSVNSPFSYPGVPFSTFHPVPCTFVLPSVGTAAYTTPSYVPNGGGGKFQNNKEDVSNSLTIGVDDEHIGVIVGRGGRNIADISQVSGARIKISDRGDFIAGTNDRKVTISGSEEAVQRAESMIMQKVASLVGR